MEQEVTAPAPPLPHRARDNPARAENAFIIYRRDKNTAYQLGCALRNLKAGEQKNVSKAIARMWHDEDPRVKEIYFHRAKLARELHKRMYPDYKFQPKRDKPKGSKLKHRKRPVKKDFRAQTTTPSTAVAAGVHPELSSSWPPAVVPTPPPPPAATFSTSSSTAPALNVHSLPCAASSSESSDNIFFNFEELESDILSAPSVEDYTTQDGAYAMDKLGLHSETGASRSYEHDPSLPIYAQDAIELPSQNALYEAPSFGAGCSYPDATLNPTVPWSSTSSRPLNLTSVESSAATWGQQQATASGSLEWDTVLAPLDAGFHDFSTVSTEATDYFAPQLHICHLPVPQPSISQGTVHFLVPSVARPPNPGPPPPHTPEPLNSRGFLGANEFNSVVPVGLPLMGDPRGVERDPDIHARFEELSSQLRNQLALQLGLSGTQVPSVANLVSHSVSPARVCEDFSGQIELKDDVGDGGEFSLDSDEARSWFNVEEL
ncbi:hypothetical protein C8Q78DRAFT_1073197 [Trametes maxima]|nr:hypothetical protein C8Q78DRAFT_1073197 [Trametes maxima]